MHCIAFPTTDSYFFSYLSINSALQPAATPGMTVYCDPTIDPPRFNPTYCTLTIPTEDEGIGPYQCICDGSSASSFRIFPGHLLLNVYRYTSKCQTLTPTISFPW